MNTDKQYQVKGSTIISKFDFVEDNFGERARQEMQKDFETRGILPVYPAMWYSYQNYVDVLTAIAEKFYGGELRQLEKVGSYSAKKSLESVYRSFVDAAGQDFVEFLNRISNLHKMFYSQGRLEVIVREDGQGCDLWHRDKPEFQEADLYVASGFYKEAARMHGIKNLLCKHSLKGPDCHFVLEWT